MPDLTTNRLLLRDFRIDDVSALHDFCSDPAVVRYVDWGPNTRADTEAFVRTVVAETRDPDRTTYSYAVVLRDSEAIIGLCSLWVESPQHRRGALGFVFHPAHWGRGYATEVGRVLLEFGHTTLQLDRLEATCRPDNLGSRGALLKAGFDQEAVLPSHVLIRGERQDSLLFASVRVRP